MNLWVRNWTVIMMFKCVYCASNALFLRSNLLIRRIFIVSPRDFRRLMRVSIFIILSAFVICLYLSFLFIWLGRRDSNSRVLQFPKLAGWPNSPTPQWVQRRDLNHFNATFWLWARRDDQLLHSAIFNLLSSALPILQAEPLSTDP